MPDRVYGGALDRHGHGYDQQRGHSERQPEAFDAAGVSHAGLLPLPAAPLGAFEALFHPAAHLVPVRVGGDGTLNARVAGLQWQQTDGGTFWLSGASPRWLSRTSPCLRSSRTR